MVRGALVAVCGLALAAAVAGCGGGSSDAARPTTTIRQLRQFRIVFPEGFTRVAMAERVQVVAKIAKDESRRRVRVSAKGYLAATAKPRTFVGFGAKKLPLEGFLFPDTYDFDRKSTSAQLVGGQLGEFASKWRTLNLAYARSKNLTPYDVLTIASMVEGEAQVPKERPLIAAVIYNRLHAHMALGIDATLRYGLHIPPTQSLTQSELQNPTPYNTRLHPGLPPTPINNPGLAALEAAAHPAHVDYLYFVRKPDHKHHYFTASYQDFLQHEAEYGY
ncbi:MAG TPA: endolytic transglycosylase MltG [Gaiellaceae bacterium]|nr:endolytic transglycosylase MltG [Gaiellaceae bacterium]